MVFLKEDFNILEKIELVIRQKAFEHLWRSMVGNIKSLVLYFLLKIIHFFYWKYVILTPKGEKCPVSIHFNLNVRYEVRE